MQEQRMPGNERIGGWNNGLDLMRKVENNPHNSQATDWYQNHANSTLSASFREKEKERQTDLAVYQQQQQRHGRPYVDSAQMWAPTHSVLARNDVYVGEAITRQGLEYHDPQVLRDVTVYRDRDGEAQKAATRRLLGMPL